MIERLRNIRLVVSDIDGTLLTADNDLHPRTLSSILQVIENHQLTFTLGTGRAFPLTYPLIELLRIHSPIIFSGGAIFDPNTQIVISNHTIQGEQVSALTRFATERNLGLIAHTADCMLCMMDDDDWDSIAHIEWIRGKNTDHARRVRELDSAGDGAIIRIDIFSEKQPLTAAYLQVCHTFPMLHAVQMTRSIELTPIGVTKGSALRLLADYLDIKMPEIMAIGDSLNDMALLEEAGVSVAMGSAPEALKAVADIIVPSSDDGGFADALDAVAFLNTN
jgi:Cof subfamily protein (haloacid dehalogenase superfamily)